MLFSSATFTLLQNKLLLDSTKKKLELNVYQID